MSEAKYIEIKEPKILKNRLLLSRLSYPREIKKYFSSNLFYVKYDKDIHNVNTSILQIPVISNVITLAWAIGADIHVKEIDRTYLESLNKIKSIMKKWYPKLAFSTNVTAEKVISNSFSSERYGLLFSGGIDSTTSYIRHKNKKPDLIMVWGADIPLIEKRFWRKVEKKYKAFADQEKVKIHFIKTNMRQFINERRLCIEFGKYLSYVSWWEGIQHGMGLLGLSAPISVEKHIGTILIASSASLVLIPYGSHPLIDNKFSWADVKVVHDGGVGRQKKIRNVLSDYIRKKRCYPTLRVCHSQFRDFNCSKCEKCLRTITGLLLENIDPNKLSLNVGDNFSDLLKHFIKDRGARELDHLRLFPWYDIQKHIHETMSHNLYNSKEFFSWLKDFDLSVYNVRKRNIRSCLRYIYYKLPTKVQNLVLEIWLKVTS